jgi:hypothetical protein
MSRPQAARALTFLAMAGALGLVGFRNRPAAPAFDALPTPEPLPAERDPTPQDAIYTALDAARAGDVAAYLSAFTGQMEQSLRQSIVEQGEPAFAKYLMETNAPVKGVALAEMQPVSGAEARVRVEFVYTDRNEAQVFHLEKQPDKRWRIARLEAAQRIPTLVPYGTPVK